MPAINGSRVVIGRWVDFLERSRPSLDRDALGSILCLDPGETTGWALFWQGDLTACGQWATPEPASMADSIHEVATAVHRRDYFSGLDLIVFEEYRVRGNKFKEHVGSEVVTIQNIGAIKVAASELKIDVVKQSAGTAKGFATDRKLRQWGLFQTNQRHANDSIRHGVYYILFAAGRHLPHEQEQEDEETGA